MKDISPGIPSPPEDDMDEFTRENFDYAKGELFKARQEIRRLMAEVQKLRDGFQEILSTVRFCTRPALGGEAIRIAKAMINE